MEKFNKLTDNRQKFLENLYKLVKNEFESPSEDIEERINTIAIDSSWGTGKSHFAEALEEYIKNKNDNNFKIDLIKFNAWENDYYEDPMKTLIGEINSQVTLGLEVKNAAETIIKNSAKAGLKVLSKLILKKFNLNDDDVSAIKNLFSGVNESSLDDYKKYKEMVENFKICLEQKDLVGGKARNKVIIVDELDRCRPDFAIETLETVKHIFDVKGIIFIFMINKKLLNKSVEQLYGTINDDEEYFKKFFNLEFSLPMIEYSDYLQKEYSEILNIQKLPQNFSLEKYGSYVFLNVISCLNDNQSTRQQKILLRKFKILHRTFSEIEKSNISFITLISLYLVFMESGKKKENENFVIWCFYRLSNIATISNGKISRYNIPAYLSRISSVFYLIQNKDYQKESIQFFGEHVEKLDSNIYISVFSDNIGVKHQMWISLPNLEFNKTDDISTKLETHIKEKCSFINDLN